MILPVGADGLINQHNGMEARPWSVVASGTSDRFDLLFATQDNRLCLCDRAV